MSRLLLLACALATCSTAYAAFDATSAESKQLGYCEGVYIYAAQFLQIQNNGGAAVNALSRASRVVAANFFLNRQGDVIPGDRLEEIKTARRTVKAQLDSDPQLVLTETSKCDKTTMPLVKRAIQKGGVLWGKNYVDLSQSLLDQYKKQLGL
jgi:hypothetical protein